METSNKKGIINKAINFSFGRFLFYTFYIPMIVLVLNQLSLWFFGHQLLDIMTFQDVIFILAGMVATLFHLAWAIITFNPYMVFAQLLDFLCGFLLLGSSFMGVIVKVWMWIVFMPFQLIKLFFGFDLLHIIIPFKMKVLRIKFELYVDINLRLLIEAMIESVVKALTPKVSPIDYFAKKARGEIVGISLDFNFFSSFLGSSALLKAFRITTKNPVEDEEE